MDVTSQQWASLVAAGNVGLHPPRTVLLRQGAPPTHVLALVRGRVKVLRASPDGSVLLLAIRGPGEILGEIAVLSEKGRSATVVTIDSCETRLIPADRFRVLVRSLGLDLHLLRHAFDRIREGEAWRAEIAALPARPRVVRALLRLNTLGSADVGLNQTELAQAVGLSRSSVAAELAELRDRGIVATRRRKIVVVDVEQLRAVADTGHGSV